MMIKETMRRIFHSTFRFFIFSILFLLSKDSFILATSASASASASASTPSRVATPPITNNVNDGHIILRIRLEDGSVERIRVTKEDQDTLTLKKMIDSFILNYDSNKKISSFSKVKIGTTVYALKKEEEKQKTILSLGLKHGSLISILKDESKIIVEESKKESYFGSKKLGSNSGSGSRWHPFPEIAKDYESAVLKSKMRRAASSGMSYGDIAKIQSSLHIIEPQKEGPIKRIYMCCNSAERFQSNCIVSKKITKGTGNNKETTMEQFIDNRCALLFGTIQRERVDLRQKKSRTSLSSTTEDTKYCDVIKVHALWEAPKEKQTKADADSCYDSSALIHYDDNDDDDDKNDTASSKWLPPSVLKVAQLLHLKPIGWIFSHDDDRCGSTGNENNDEDTLPVFAHDIQTGAKIQINNMKTNGRMDGSKFITIAMDCKIGATEAFQFSDVTVQMVSENIWDLDNSSSKSSSSSSRGNKKNEGKKGESSIVRYIRAKHGILCDGQEKKEFDSVLCLVNTAMLSHEGLFTNKEKNNKNPTKINNKGNILLTLRLKKQISKAIKENNDEKLLEILCDFNVLIAMHALIKSTIFEELCALVRKYGRGQKKGATISNAVKLHLRKIVEI